MAPAPVPAFDLYEALEVSQTATSEEIRQSYRQLALRHHPDKNPGDASAKDRFQRISLAYEHLSNDAKRNLYDNRNTRPHPTQPFSSGFDREYYYDFGSEFDPDDDYYYVGSDLDEYLARIARYEADWKKQEAAWEAQVDGDRARAREEYLAREKAERERREARVRAKREEVEQSRKWKEDREKAEKVLQEQRWYSLNVTTEEEKQKTCYHSEFWPKEQQKKKFKCGECNQKRGMASYKCPHCSLLVCQICVGKLRDPKLNGERKLNTERDHKDDRLTESKALGTEDSQSMPEAHEEYPPFTKATLKFTSAPKNPFAIFESNDEGDEELVFRERSTPSTTTGNPPKAAPSSLNPAPKATPASQKSKVAPTMLNVEQRQSGKVKVAQTTGLGNGKGQGSGNKAVTSKAKNGKGSAATSTQYVPGNGLVTCPVCNERMMESAVDDHIHMCNSTAPSANGMDHPTSQLANDIQNKSGAAPPSSSTTLKSNSNDTSQPTSSLPTEQPKAEVNRQTVITPIAQANTSKARVSEEIEAAGEKAIKACKLQIKTPSSGPTRAFIKFVDPKKSITFSRLTQAMEEFGDVTEVKYVEKPFGRAKKLKIFAEVLFTKPEGLKRAISASSRSVAQGSILIMKMKQSEDSEQKSVVPDATVLKHSLEELQTELEVEKAKFSNLGHQCTLQQDKVARTEEEPAEQKQKFSELEVRFNEDKENLVEVQDTLRSKHALIKELESERKHLLPAKARVDELEKELEELMGNFSTMKTQSEEGWEKLLKAETDLSSKQARVDKYWDMLCEAQTEIARRQAIISQQAENLEKAEKDLVEKQGIIDYLKRECDALLLAQNKYLTPHQPQGVISIQIPAHFEAKAPGATKGYVRISFDPSRTLNLRLLMQVMEGFGAVSDAGLMSPSSAFVTFVHPWGLKNAIAAGIFFIGEATVRVTQFRDSKLVTNENHVNDPTGSSQPTSIHDHGKNDENQQSANHEARNERTGRRGRNSFASLNNRDKRTSQPANISSSVFVANKDGNQSPYPSQHQSQAPKRGGRFVKRGNRNSFTAPRNYVQDSRPADIATPFNIPIKDENQSPYPSQRKAPNQSLYPPQHQATRQGRRSVGTSRGGGDGFASLGDNPQNSQLADSSFIRSNNDNYQYPYSPPHQTQNEKGRGGHISKAGTGNFTPLENYLQDSRPATISTLSIAADDNENQSPHQPQHETPKRGRRYVGRGNRGFRGDKRGGRGYGNRRGKIRDEGVI